MDSFIHNPPIPIYFLKKKIEKEKILLTTIKKNEEITEEYSMGLISVIYYIPPIPYSYPYLG